MTDDIAVIIETTFSNSDPTYTDKETRKVVEIKPYLLPYMHAKLSDILDDFVERGIRLDSDKISSDIVLTPFVQNLETQGAELSTYTTEDMVNVLETNKYSAEQIYDILMRIGNFSGNQREIILGLEKKAVDDMQPEQIYYIKHEKSGTGGPVSKQGDHYYPSTVVLNANSKRLRTETEFPTMKPGITIPKGEMKEIERNLLTKLYTKC